VPQSPAGFTLSHTCDSHPCRVFCVARSSYPCPVFCIARLSRIHVVYSVLCVLCRALVAHMCSVSRVRHISVSRVLCYALVAHLCHVFYVAGSVSRARRAHVFCIARSSRTYILYRALVAYLCRMFYVASSVSRARRARVFCIARSSRICVADSASRARRVSALCVMCRALVACSVIRSLHLCLTSFLYFVLKSLSHTWLT